MADTYQVTATPKLKLQATCPSNAHTNVTVGQHEILIDEPESLGGTNLGPSPGQVYLASLLGCTNVITKKCAKAHGVVISEMKIDAVVEVDPRGMRMMEEIDLAFPTIALNISIKTDADEPLIEKVKSDLHKFCPISRAMKQSGTVISENWIVTQM